MRDHILQISQDSCRVQQHSNQYNSFSFGPQLEVMQKKHCAKYFWTYDSVLWINNSAKLIPESVLLLYSYTLQQL